MIKVGNLLKVVKGNRFVGDVVVVTRVDAENGIFDVLNKEGSRLVFKLEEADNFLKYYSIADAMEEEDGSIFIDERNNEFVKNGGELVLNKDYSLISDIYTLADILKLIFVKKVN